MFPVELLPTLPWMHSHARVRGALCPSTPAQGRDDVGVGCQPHTRMPAQLLTLLRFVTFQAGSPSPTCPQFLRLPACCLFINSILREQMAGAELGRMYLLLHDDTPLNMQLSQT